jgi:HEAT repeat protein
MLQRLQAYLCLPDQQLALVEAENALLQHPSSKKILQTALKLYAKSGNEDKALQLLQEHILLFGAEEIPRDCLEEISWGVIEKGAKGSVPLVRAIALIAAAIGDDARGVSLLACHVSDQHRAVRGLAVEFSSHFRDATLQDAILERLKKEQDPEVRLALLSAVGPMKIESAENELLAVLEHERTTAEEKAAAIGSLADLKETVSEREIAKFVVSSRAGIRALAAKLIESNAREEDCKLILPLLCDTHSEVRKAALEALGTLRVKAIETAPICDVVRPLLEDTSPSVAITCAWLLAVNQSPLGQKALSKWLESANQQERIMAAAALAGAGKYGFPLTAQAFKRAQDPYVRLNLALALVRNGIQEEIGLEAIFEAVMYHPEKWMTKELGRFEAIVPCDAPHRADIPGYPEALNQTTRLEILNLLAVKEHHGALEAATHFLKERPWGVTGAASALLLTEGDEEALALIRALLNDPSEKIQLQAALLLAAWGNDPEALMTLQKLYPGALRRQKEQIVEAVGRIGDKGGLPFLIKCLEDPHQTLRMIAASSILQTLYH